MPQQFNCVDCSGLVVIYGQTHANDNPVCLTCAFLRCIDDPEERAQVRRRLFMPIDGGRREPCPETLHARDCEYVTSDGPAPCTCGAAAFARRPP